RFGEVIEHVPPKVKIGVERSAVADMLGRILREYTIMDVSVEDPPLEQVIADMFSTAVDDREDNESSTTPEKVAQDVS
ncbi:MAG: hypothetical protein WEA31_04870, partial [Pirellulales bacterium]